MDTTNMVENTAPVAVEEAATPLSEVLESEPEAQEPVEAEAPAEPDQPRQEPKYLAGKRAKWEAAHRAEMDELRGQLAVLQDYFNQQEADKLVASGKIADREMAMEYLKLKGGKPIEKQATQPRDDQGRFVAKGEQKARELFLQAQTIQKSTGVDVMTLYHNDPDVKERVNSGEWDFTDVYQSTLKPKAPPVVRGGSGGSLDTPISKMSSKAWAEMNERLARGERFDARR